MEKEKFIRSATCIVRIDCTMLLGKKRHRFGKGLYQVYGGKVEAGETFMQAAIRELYEEARIHISAPYHVANLTFHNLDGENKPGIFTQVFQTHLYEGIVIETDEMTPEWFSVNDPMKDLPYGEMFPDSKFWIPEVLKGRRIEAEFFCTDDFRNINTTKPPIIKDMQVSNPTS